MPVFFFFSFFFFGIFLFYCLNLLTQIKMICLSATPVVSLFLFFCLVSRKEDWIRGLVTISLSEKDVKSEPVSFAKRSARQLI